MIGDYYGFVYCITNKVNGKMYIGRKYFYKSRKKVGKRRVFLESDWKEYWSSSKLVHEEIEKYGKENFVREILSLHITKGDTNYFENYMLFRNNVLEATKNGERLFYNDNIMNRYYARSMTRVSSLRIINKKSVSIVV